MSQVSLILLDADRYFADMLSAYIRASDYAERFVLRICTRREEAMTHLSGSAGTSLLLMHESWLPFPEATQLFPDGRLFVISDSASYTPPDGYPGLHKYQPLNRLLGELSSRYNEANAERPLLGRKETQAIAVCSATGGVGKTAVAVHLAHQLSLQGSRALVLGLERLPSRLWYPQLDGDVESFSQLLYYAKTNPALIAGNMERWKRKHPQHHYDYIPPLTDLREWDDIFGEDVRNLIAGIKAAKLYDWIIADTDSSPNGWLGPLLDAVDRTLWLVTEDPVQLAKTSDWFRAWRAADEAAVARVLPGLRFVVNRSAEGAARSDPSRYGIEAAGRLPYEPAWMTEGAPERLSGRFAAAAAALATGEGGHGPHGLRTA